MNTGPSSCTSLWQVIIPLAHAGAPLFKFYVRPGALNKRFKLNHKAEIGDCDGNIIVKVHIIFPPARGIGDPLVANYLRCFVCRMGGIVDPGFDSYLHPLFQDALFIYPQVFSNPQLVLVIIDKF